MQGSKRSGTTLAIVCVILISIVAGPLQGATARSDFAVVPEATTHSYSMILSKGTTQQFRLSFNPTTGTEWWLETVSSADLVVTFAGTESGTQTCPPGIAGCGEEVDVFSITSNVVGAYVAEFRLGHPWNHAEYYESAFLHVDVIDGTAQVDVDVKFRGEVATSPIPLPRSDFWVIVEEILGDPSGKLQVGVGIDVTVYGQGQIVGNIQVGSQVEVFGLYTGADLAVFQSYHYIRELFITKVSAIPTSGQASLTVEFQSSVSGGSPPYRYVLDYGDGSEHDERVSMQNSVSTTHIYKKLGTFIAVLSVVDLSGKSATDSATIVVNEPTATVSIEAVDNKFAGDSLKAFFREILKLIPGVDDFPLISASMKFKVSGSADVQKIILRFTNSTTGLEYRQEIEVPQSETVPGSFYADVGANRKFSHDEQVAAVAFLFIDLFVLESPKLPDPVKETVRRLLDCFGDEADKGKNLVDAQLTLKEAIPVLGDGTQLEPTYFSYKLPTLKEGMEQEDPNALAAILAMFVAIANCGPESRTSVLVTTSSGTRVGALYENGVLREVNEVADAYYSGLGTWPQVIILPYSQERYKIDIHALNPGEVRLFAAASEPSELVISMSEQEELEASAQADANGTISLTKIEPENLRVIPWWERYQTWLLYGALTVITVSLVGVYLARSRSKRGRTSRRRSNISDVTTGPRIVEVSSAPMILEIKEEE